jgi:uncharacterized protein (DUF433 family)
MSNTEIAFEDGKLGGEPFLEGTRIRVSDIAVKYEKLGYSIDEILKAYPRLERCDVHEALAYFYRHEDEISDLFDENPVRA